VIGGASRVKAASGDALILGSAANSAGTTNTSLTTASSGTALLVTQNGSGTAVRGSAVGAGSIAGFFTAQNGTGISGVTGNSAKFGVFGQNNGGAGTGAAVRASGVNNHGVDASTNNGVAHAVRGINSGANGIGVRGYSASGAGGKGVFGTSATNGVGVWGDSATGIGVFGMVASGSGVEGNADGGNGVYGSANNGYGVYGYSNNSTGVRGFSSLGYGVYGFSVASDAGYFQGNLYATTVSGGIKAFRIDHPLDPAGKVLMHSCVESNERLTVYAGTVTTDASGEATVELPAYFEALNRDLRYQLTVIGSFAQAMVKHKVAGNRFMIATSEPDIEVSWQVTGVRQDAYATAHPLVVEQAKVGKEKGRFLNPLEHGQPESAGVNYEQAAASPVIAVRP
jgi:hypothetical protein